MKNKTNEQVVLESLQTLQVEYSALLIKYINSYDTRRSYTLKLLALRGETRGITYRTSAEEVGVVTVPYKRYATNVRYLLKKSRKLRMQIRVAENSLQELANNINNLAKLTDDPKSYSVSFAILTQ